ncbi:MAG: DUF4145 domain-containing protein [Candidatus Paceibacterota bacterium]
MILIQSPIIKLFLKEAEKMMENSFNLSFIMICGLICELSLKELCNSTKKFSELLEEAKKGGLISSYEYDAFDDIRKTRNKYAHWDIYKIIYQGLVVVEPDQKVSFIEEKDEDDIAKVLENEIFTDTHRIMRIYPVLLDFLKKN